MAAYTYTNMFPSGMVRTRVEMDGTRVNTYLLKDRYENWKVVSEELWKASRQRWLIWPQSKGNMMIKP